MPVRSRSAASMAAMAARPPCARSVSSSSAGRKAGPREARLAPRRHLVHERALQQIAEVHQRAQGRRKLGQQWRGAARKKRSQLRHLPQRGAQPRQIARRALPHRQPSQKALHVQHRAQPRGDLLPQHGCLRQLLHRVLPRADLREVEQRRGEPAREQPPSRRRQRAVHHREQGARLAAVRPAEQFQVLHRAGIENELPLRLRHRDAHHVPRQERCVS